MVIDGWGTIVGSVFNSGWFAYRPMTLDIFPQRVSTDDAWKTSLHFRATPLSDIANVVDALKTFIMPGLRLCTKIVPKISYVYHRLLSVCNIRDFILPILINSDLLEQ